MSLKSYQCIIFDWDGTLMNSADKIALCLQAAAADIQLPVPTLAAAKDVIGLGLHDAMQVVFGGLDKAVTDDLVERYRHHYLHANQTAQPLFDGVREGLAELQQSGAFLCVATGKARRGLDRVLHQETLQDMFVYTRCADESRTKPHPQMLHDILDYLALEADRALMIGDTSYDMEMASGAGMDAVAMGYGVHSTERLRACGAQQVFDDFSQLLGWLMPRAQPAYQQQG